MASNKQNPSPDAEDSNLVTLADWKKLHGLKENSDESPHFRSLSEGVLNHLDCDDTLGEETLGSGLAAMVQLAEQLARLAGDSVSNIKNCVSNRISEIMLRIILRR